MARLAFSIRFENQRLPATYAPQSHRLRVVFRGDGITRLAESTIDVVAPSLADQGCASLSGPGAE